MATVHSHSDQASGSGIYLKFPRISGFTVLEHVHEGSHSSIYRARQDRLGRVIALKVLPEWPPPTDVALERFNRSAYVSAQAPHPNLLTLYDTGTRDGYHFACLEFAIGQTLQRHAGQVAHTDERFALNVGLQIARALTALHSRDICHRNVKPKNIFLETSGGVRLIGLGLSSCRSAFFSPHLDAHPIGTPHFMAPEMIRGCCSDPRSDLYSLGVTLYVMTAGRPPFDVGIPAAIMTQHLNDAPHPLERLRPELSGDFVAIVHKLIAREPEQRLQSALAVSEALETLLKHKPLPLELDLKHAPKPAPPASPLPPPVRRSGRVGKTLAHPVSIALASVFATVLLLFGLTQLAGWVWQGKPAAVKNEAAEAEEFRRLMQADATFMAQPSVGADAWAEFLGAFPEAGIAHQQYASAKLELFLKLANEQLLNKRLKSPARPSQSPRPAPPAEHDGGLDF